MKITLNWLREHIDCSWDAHELAERLTRSGLEREVLEDISERYRGVVVGEVINCSPHPRADKLSVCKVNIGSAKCSTIVCGAPNVKSGIHVPVAKVGATLKNGEFKIKKAKLRGVQSNGMICSGKELAINNDHAGIMIVESKKKLGKPATVIPW